ncbi:iron ABC transporter permease [Fusobacterium sp. SYSU M8D902]|uniref:FecCD family ABC transporter permease n=1 Tax=Fusobacterium sp. SYSU M8D902 TaxID=3159562 RepID=UPI0032E4A070
MVWKESKMIIEKKFNWILLLILIVTIFFSLFYGSVKVPIGEIIKVLFNQLGGFDFPVEKKSFTSIVFYVRLPRVLIGVIVGGALAICGCTMQSLLKNPIADSSIVGISSGASLGAIIAISLGITGHSLFVMPILAIVMALFVAGLVYGLASLKGRTDNLLLILSGIAVSSFVGSISSLLLTTMVEAQLKEYIFWSIGSLSGRRWEHFNLAIVPISILIFLLTHYGKELNILLLGDEEAKALGIDIKSLRKRILIIVSLITSISVCISGNIGFVGLIIPHILRKLIGSDNRKLLKTSFLAGAFFITLCDLISRTLFAPVEVGVGIITAIVGAPYFIYLIIKIRKNGERI